MSIIVKLFLMAYLVVMVLLSILSVFWVLSLIFTPQWLGKKAGAKTANVMRGHHQT